MIHVQADLILACDGAHSAVRRSLMAYPLFQYSQEYIEHGKVFTHRLSHDGTKMFFIYLGPSRESYLINLIFKGASFLSVGSGSLFFVHSFARRNNEKRRERASERASESNIVFFSLSLARSPFFSLIPSLERAHKKGDASHCRQKAYNPYPVLNPYPYFRLY